LEQQRPPGTSPQKIHKTIEIFFNKTDGQDVKLDNRNLYHMNIHGGRKNPGLAICSSYDAHGPQLAASRFKNPEQDFEVFIGGQYSEGMTTGT
jgi:hypothetical protein